MPEYQVTSFQFYGVGFILFMLLIAFALSGIAGIHEKTDKRNRNDQEKSFYDRCGTLRIHYRNGMTDDYSGSRHSARFDWRNIVSYEELGKDE